MKKIKITVEYDEGNICKYELPLEVTLSEMICDLASMLIFLGFSAEAVENYLDIYGERRGVDDEE